MCYVQLEKVYIGRELVFSNTLRVLIILIFLGLAVWAITLTQNEQTISDSSLGLWFVQTIVSINPNWESLNGIPINDWLTEALKSIGSELAGIVIGIVTIDFLNERRQEQQLKQQLILQMSSRHNDVAETAVAVLRARGWLEDGTLIGADLNSANLSGVDLSKANLKKANLQSANLQGANLSHIKLTKADLCGANLQEANLSNANLVWAKLDSADLRAANVVSANLQHAWMRWAKLDNAELGESKLWQAVLTGASFQGVGWPHSPVRKFHFVYIPWRWLEPGLLPSFFTRRQHNFMAYTNMPDGYCLNGDILVPNDLPTFEEWEFIQTIANTNDPLQLQNWLHEEENGLGRKFIIAELIVQLNKDDSNRYPLTKIPVPSRHEHNSRIFRNNNPSELEYLESLDRVYTSRDSTRVNAALNKRIRELRSLE